MNSAAEMENVQTTSQMSSAVTPSALGALPLTVTAMFRSVSSGVVRIARRPGVESKWIMKLKAIVQ